MLLLPLPFPFCNNGQAATVKLVNLLKHSVYFGLGDQPTFIGETDHSLLVPPSGAPGPEPNKARDRTQRGDRQKPLPAKTASFSPFRRETCRSFDATLG
jgi:hypothetical protein